MEKVYIALFSCCVTRAIHLELVEDLSAAAFRRCLRRFTARCGTPALFVSDNAKTFQATEKALNELFDHPETQADLERMRIEWKFNLERAPWCGDSLNEWSRLLKIVCERHWEMPDCLMRSY